MVDGKIYKITNLINGKIYIGQTIMPLSRRWRAHCSGKDHSMKIALAINKYGKENFTIEVIDTAENLDDLNKKEELYISQYDCTNDSEGYNILSGGGNRRLPDSIKEKISKANTGRVVTEELRERLSKISKKKWNDSGYKERAIEERISRWKNPIFRENHKKSMRACHTEKFRKEAGDRFRAMWGDPGYKKRMVAKIRKIGKSKAFKETMSRVNTKISMERYSRKFVVYKAVVTEKKGWQTSAKYTKGELVGHWTHKKTCAEDLGIYWTGVSQALIGTIKQYKKYIFEYVE
jgi:group I intron endonuclease